MTASGWVYVGLAGGFVALALYGKYRILKQGFEEAREGEGRRLAAPPDGPDVPS